MFGEFTINTLLVGMEEKKMYYYRPKYSFEAHNIRFTPSFNGYGEEREKERRGGKHSSVQRGSKNHIQDRENGWEFQCNLIIHRFWCDVQSTTYIYIYVYMYIYMQKIKNIALYRIVSNHRLKHESAFYPCNSVSHQNLAYVLPNLKCSVSILRYT